MKLPFDIEPNLFNQPMSELEAEVHNLDEFGWNTKNRFGGLTYVRLNMVTEDILDFSFTTIPGNSAGRAR